MIFCIMKHEISFLVFIPYLFLGAFSKWEMCNKMYYWLTVWITPRAKFNSNRTLLVIFT